MNVALRRTELRVSQSELAARLRVQGRAVQPSSISKIESGERRIDVDDLVSLARALDASPARLLLSASADASPLQLTDIETVSEREAWLWASGLRHLGATPWDGRDELDIDRRLDFMEVNRPYEPPNRLSFGTAVKHAEVLADVWIAVRAARQKGLTVHDVIDYVTAMEQHVEQSEQSREEKHHDR